MTTPFAPISYNDVNAEMGLSPRVISSTYRYVNFLEGHNPAEVAWSRLRSKSRFWGIYDDVTPVWRAAHQSTVRSLTSYWPATTVNDSFTVVFGFGTNWGYLTGQTAAFTVGTAMEQYTPIWGFKATYQGKFVYDGGDSIYAYGWLVRANGSKMYAITSGIDSVTYLPRI